MKLFPLSPRIKQVLKLLIGISILAWLLIRFDPHDILAALAGVNIVLLAIAIVVYASTLFLLSLRWRFILSRLGYEIPPVVAYQGFVAGILISDLTPARVGELSRPLTIRDRVPVPAGLGSVFLDRYCDFIAIFILGSGGILLISAAHSPVILLVSIAILSIPITVLSLFWFRRSAAIRLIKRFGIAKVTDFAVKFGDAMDNLAHPIRTMSISIGGTLGVWILQSLRLVLIAGAAGFVLPIQQMVFIQPLISALALIPLSLSGLGFVEGGYVTIFAQYGIPAAAGLAIALLDRFLTVSVHLILGLRYALQTLGK